MINSAHFHNGIFHGLWKFNRILFLKIMPCCFSYSDTKDWKGESFILLLAETSAEKRNPSSFSHLKVAFKNPFCWTHDYFPGVYQMMSSILREEFQANALASYHSLYKACYFCYRLYLIKWYCVHLATCCGQKQQQALILPAVGNSPTSWAKNRLLSLASSFNMKNMKYTMDYITVPDKSITL